MMHHPYTDPFNNRYIVPIAERCKAQLVLGGHLHYYIKSVSVDPKVGARTVYICEGSAQDPEAEYTPAREEKRLFSEFPEVTAKGRSNYGILDVTEKAIDYRLYGFRQDGSPELVDTIHLTHDEPEITFTDIELRRLDNNGNVEVRALAENRGTSMAEASSTCSTTSANTLSISSAMKRTARSPCSNRGRSASSRPSIRLCSPVSTRCASRSGAEARRL